MLMLAAANSDWGRGTGGGWTGGEMVFVIVVTLAVFWLIGWWTER